MTYGSPCCDTLNIFNVLSRERESVDGSYRMYVYEWQTRQENNNPNQKMLTNKADYHQYLSGKSDKMYTQFRPMCGFCFEAHTHTSGSVPLQQPVERMDANTLRQLRRWLTTILQNIHSIWRKLWRLPTIAGDDGSLCDRSKYTQITITFLKLLRSYIGSVCRVRCGVCVCVGARWQRIEWKMHNIICMLMCNNIVKRSEWDESDGIGSSFSVNGDRRRETRGPSVLF